MKLTKNDFELLNFVMTAEGRNIVIMPKPTVHSISLEDAFKLYEKGEIVAKTYEEDGEPIFRNLAEGL